MEEQKHERMTVQARDLHIGDIVATGVARWRAPLREVYVTETAVRVVSCDGYCGSYGATEEVDVDRSTETWETVTEVSRPLAVGDVVRGKSLRALTVSSLYVNAGMSYFIGDRLARPAGDVIRHAKPIGTTLTLPLVNEPGAPVVGHFEISSGTRLARPL